MNPLDLISEDSFLSAVRTTMQRKTRTPAADVSRQASASRVELEEREKQLRTMMKSNKVVVFQRDVLTPWDRVPRFDFLDCNLGTVMQEKEEFKSKNVVRMAKFIGDINQLKPAAAKKKEKNVSAFEKQQLEHEDKYNKVMTIGPKKRHKSYKPQNENSMRGMIDLYRAINEQMYTRVQDIIPNSDSIGLSKE